ncbi:phage tail protein [Burkholderia sp. Bp9017]|uniref:phage tail protein n=1 Tax=Burkholderia TaxID=32008 RepID=UPI000F5D53BE|nr:MULTISPECIES: phage tail protein [Burkholderia]MBY4865421.1 phage tail protein [Burkholderia anthina]RQZ24811.1 phage tail protein [Burkholderia sp. Bp9017]RQZ32818.1 phage tail protein [Burkholderia sp. Bp9016]
MSAPENSNSKTPPSLLSDSKPAGEGGPQQSRILANLEGRVTPPAESSRRSLKGPVAAVVALVVAVGGWGAWRWQQQSGETAVVAAAPAQATAKAEPASGAAQVAQNAASAASAVQPATIVNEDAASSTVASASSVSGTDNSRLSRALADGADDTPGAATAGAAAAATAAAVATTKTAKADAAKNDKVAARSKAEARADAKAEARKHHKEQVELAQAKKRRETAARTGGARSSGKDDPDADLLAALVARTKPADKKAAAQKAQAGPTKTAAATGGSLASRVKDCSERGFFEDQLCRWRVCEGHWGKDPACPTAAQSETRQ